MSKKTLGRQKIEMVKMTKESNLQVTFSKRRTGLFKKASELSTLCGADVAVVVFSPGKKVFSFGNPNVDTIIDRFLTQNNISPPTSTSMPLIEARRNANVHDLNVQLMQVLSELEMEKKRGKELAQMRKTNRQAGCWWEAPIEELNLPQLEQLKVSLEELKKNVTKEAEKLVFQPPINPHPQYLATCSSNGTVPPPFNMNVPKFNPRIASGFNPPLMHPGYKPQL